MTVATWIGPGYTFGLFDSWRRWPDNRPMVGERLGSIEAGGTKWVCAVGTDPDNIVARTRIATTTPSETLAKVVGFFAEHDPVRAVGIAAFGPLELRSGHGQYGSITSTPKPGWSGTDLIGVFRDSLAVPVAIDTDVNGAALGEGRWGAARGLASYVYVTVGTGIGGGAVISGQAVRALGHPEMGHMAVKRHPSDEFAGACPFHGDCWEGLASGPALSQRWGADPRHLPPEVRRSAIELEAFYVGQGLRNIVMASAPERIVLGGGVSHADGFFPLVRSQLVESLAGYPGLPEHRDESFVVPPRLGDLAGVAGGFVLAELALADL